MTEKGIFNWSGGKDSALALYYLLKENKHNIQSLLTTVNKEYQRISMHGVREELLQQQAASIGLPVQKLELPEECSMAEYNRLMAQLINKLRTDGYTHSYFGDIFLEDLKEYRENMLSQIGIEAGFPLWKRDTSELIEEFLDLGFKTIVVCADSSMLDKSFSGRIIDKDFLRDLPHNVDPCGENGEFHTFVFDGPIFDNPVKVTPGEIIYREYPAPDKTQAPKGYWFQELLAGN